MSPSEEIASMSASAPAAKPEWLRKILVVDDSEFSREVTREMLEERGFEVVLLASTLGLSSTLSLEKPDLVLLDVEMPALPGDQAVAVALRHALHRCPILLYSGRPPSELESLARSCGAQGFISKTSDADALVGAILPYLG
jgi:two-component system, OmpR family, response regulator